MPSSAPSTRSASSSAPSGEAIAEKLHRYEELLREAHIAGLDLVLSMRLLQTDAGMTAITGHAMFARFDEAQAQVSGAITTAAAGHRLARSVATTVGLDPMAYGETTDPEAAPETRRQLARVA